MQDGLRELNEELLATYGVTLANRIGVNTGGVVAGDATTNQRLITGDPVNVAARLEQAAGDTETLIGELTYKLVADAVDVEEVEPLTLKGKAAPVAAYRLVGLRTVEAAPTVQQQLVGRRHELDELLALLDEVAASSTPQTMLVLGEAGVGKTRLLDEFVGAAAAEALVLRGRCLSYGEGITFWPLVEALRSGAGVTDADDAAAAFGKLQAFAGLTDVGVVDRVASMIGLSDATFPLADLFWGFRRLLENISRRRPVVLLIEDLHWAEPTLHDLLESLSSSDFSAGALTVCSARTELLESRPELATAPAITLGRLGESETAAMVEAWLGGPLDAAGLTRIVAASSGNPLFTRQLLSMLHDDGLLIEEDGSWVLASLPSGWLPPTIHALLSARIDRLSTEDRRVVDPASVIGHIFALAAVAELADGADPGDVEQRADELERTQFLQRAAEQDGIDFRAFHHIFIRDSVYESLLKRQRASLHERFVQWADRVNGDRALEYEEILGYHLEQAHRFLSELAPADDHVRELGADAARRLQSAGSRAFVRGDMPAAANLLRRAYDILPAEAPERFAIAPDLGEALMQIGQFPAAEALLTQTQAEAERLHKLELAGGARVVLQLIRLFSGGADDWSDEARAIGEDVATTAAQHGDESSVARAYRLLAWVDGKACRYGSAADSLGKAIEHAQAAGDIRQQRRASTAYALTSATGPTPVEEALERCAEVAEGVAGDRQAEALILCVTATLEAMRGSFDTARDLCTQSRQRLEELGLQVEAAAMVLESSRVETLAGDYVAAEEELRRGFNVLTAIGERYVLSSLAGLLAQTLWLQGRHDEADDMSALAEELSDPDDIDAQVNWRCVQSKVLALGGEGDRAEELARSAVALLEPTDAYVLQIEAYASLGEVLVMLDRPGAGDAFQRAHELADAKGSDVLVARVLAIADAAR
jgi:predicted ATPase